MSDSPNPQDIKVGDLVMLPQNTTKGVVYRVIEVIDNPYGRQYSNGDVFRIQPVFDFMGHCNTHWRTGPNKTKARKRTNMRSYGRNLVKVEIKELGEELGRFRTFVEAYLAERS